jgi:hypothetical protein
MSEQPKVTALVVPATLEELVKPLMRWLDENHHPHTTLIVTNDHAELLEGLQVVRRNETEMPFVD